MDDPSVAAGLFGDGEHDDTEAIQARLDSGAALVELPAPAREYRISKTLRIGSGQELRLPKDARVRLADGSNCPMLGNCDWEDGNRDVAVSGGIWDMNNLGQRHNVAALFWMEPERRARWLSEQKEAVQKANPWPKKFDPCFFTGACFKLFRINLIPAFWGDEKYYGNALRIYFQEEKSTWVVLNLDSKVTDFLFWMAHEIGHSIAPSLHGQDSEDFADNFARALLFPPSEADALYRKIGSKSVALPIILATAKSWNVSPYTIYKSLVCAEGRCGRSPSRLPPAKTVMGAANSHAAKETVAQIVFRGDQPSSADFVRKSEKWLETDFFKALAAYLSQNATGNPPIADLAHLLGLSPDDAYGVIRFLTQEA